ncbi:MAG: hypothetical protein MJZ16_00790 [Bacteroidales bacterium]|nr:hypothetical protein [Bacteroidales bacterium]
MKVFLAALVLLAFGIFGMCFNIIFRKDGEFPEYEVGENKKMRQLGIKCMKEQEDELFGRGKNKRNHHHCNGDYNTECEGCGFYPFEKH